MDATDARPASRSGTRSRRRALIDPRFVIGILLVLLSVIGVVTLVNSANASVEVLSARTTLAPGERVRVDDLVPTSVRVGHTASLYLTTADVPSGGVIITRAVRAGELVPTSAVGRSQGKRLTSIVVAVSGELPQSIDSGSRVDLWATPDASQSVGSDPTTDGTQPSDQPPAVLVSGATVVRLVVAKQFVQTSGTSVELLVPKTDVASVLDAIATGATLSVLPVDLPLGG